MLNSMPHWVPVVWLLALALGCAVGARSVALPVTGVFDCRAKVNAVWPQFLLDLPQRQALAGTMPDGE